MANGIGDRTAGIRHEGRAAFGPSRGRSDVAEAFRVCGRLAGLSPEHVGELDTSGAASPGAGRSIAKTAAVNGASPSTASNNIWQAQPSGRPYVAVAEKVLA